MYNGIGLTTPRGSGTNGHVQRNWAFVRSGKKDNSNYRSEEDIKKLDATLNRPPNKDILDHDRKRKIEVKCLEFEEILEKQGLSSDEIKTKVESYRKKLMGQGKSDIPKDEFGRIAVRDSHQIAEAQQEKNAKLREAFNISEYFVEGSSFDSDRKAKEDLAKTLALQKELDSQREQTAAEVAKEKELSKRYPLERTPSMDHDIPTGGLCAPQADNGHNTSKKKKKKRTRETSTSPERKKDKKKKSKKRKKESKARKSKKLRKRKGSESDCNAENYKESVDEDSVSEIDADIKKNRKKWKKDKKKRKNKKKEVSSSSDISRSSSPMSKHLESKKSKTFTERTPPDDEFLSRSDMKSQKPKESRKHHYEPSRYSRDRIKLRSNSHSDKNLSSRRHRGDMRDSDFSPDYRSRERNDADNNSKGHENRNSRSRQRSKHEISDEGTKNPKRKRYEEYSKRKRDSSSIGKRKRHSRSYSPPLTSHNQNKKYFAKTTEIEDSLSMVHSKTPRNKSQDNQKKNSKSRSRSSSAKESMRKKSHTPLPRTSKKCEARKSDTNTFSNQEKSDKTKSTSFNYSDKKLDGPKSRSRNTSTSSSNTSSNYTGTSKSRTPSPKKIHLEKNNASKGNDQQKPIEQRIKSLTPTKTPTLSNRRSMSKSKSGYLLNEKSRKGKQRSNSRSEEWFNKSKETREENEKMSYRTPPSKVEKKALSPRSSRDSSELSYSPATRNPERYRDILENTKHHKTERSKIGDKEEDIKDVVKSLKPSDEREWDRKEKVGKSDKNQAKPVVRLQSQSDEDSDAIERNTEKILDEFQEFKREKDLKDLKMLEQLKTDIAAKAKEKIKIIEKMAASTSASTIPNNDGEVSDKSYKRTLRNSLNDFLAANNVAPAVVATCSPTDYNNIPNSPPGAIYPQTLEEIKKEQEFVILKESSNQMEDNNNKDNERQVNCKKSLVTASGHAAVLSPTTSSLHTNVNVINKERDRKRERDIRERERERETNYFNNDRYLEKRQRSSPNFFNTGGCGSGGTIGIMAGGRRNINNSMLNINHRQQRLNVMCNSAGVGGHHHHSHIHPHHNHPNHKIINNHHSSSSSTIYIANNSSTNPHTLICNHSNNSTNISFNRPSRINNTPLITATQFNNQMLSKQSNSILVNRRDHRTALNLGLSGTPCTNFSNSNLLLTKANNNPHHLHTAAVGHVVGGGHHHQYHHHHHHHRGQSSMISSNPATQITDRILIAASIAAAQRHSLGVHSAASSAAAVAAANNLNFLQQQNKPKLVIKPFKINDSQPLVAALADSSLVDAIVSKVSTATVAAAESAARRSRSRSRRSQSRNRHEEKTSSGGSNSGRGGGERDGNRRRSTSHSRSSRSSTSSRSRSRTPSHRSLRSHSSQSSSSSHTSSRSSSSSSFGSSRSGTRSPSIPRRRGSPSFLDRRRITSARKRPIPYHRKLPSDVSSCYCSSCCSRDSSPRSRSPSRGSRSPSRFF